MQTVLESEKHSSDYFRDVYYQGVEDVEFEHFSDGSARASIALKSSYYYKIPQTIKEWISTKETKKWKLTGLDLSGEIPTIVYFFDKPKPEAFL